MVTLTLLIIVSVLCTILFFVTLAEIAVKRLDNGTDALFGFLASLIVSILLIVSAVTLNNAVVKPTVEMCIKTILGGN